MATKDQPKRDEPKRDEPKRDEPKRDEPPREAGAQGAPRGFFRSHFLMHDVGASFMAVLDILLVLGLLVALNAAVTRAGCNWNHRGDWTAIEKKKRVYALSQKTVKFIEDINKPVGVFVFVAPPGGQTEFMYEDIKELLTRMQSHTRFLSVEYVNIDTEQQRALELIKEHGLTIDRDAFAQVDLGSAVGGQVIFVSDKRKKSVNFFDTVKYKMQQQKKEGKQVNPRIQAFKGEEMFLNALIAVTQRRQPRVCFSSGHMEASAKGYSDLDLAFAAQELKRQNFQTETLEKLSGQVPVRCDILVVAAPKVPLQQSEVSSVQAYLDKGGKLVVMPRTLDMSGKTWSRTGLEDLLERYGVHIEDALAMDATTAVRLMGGDVTIVPLAWLAEQGWNAEHPIGKAMTGKRLKVPSPRALKALSKPELESVVVLSTKTDKEAWGERDLYGRMGYDPKRDIPSPVPVMVAARERKQNGARVVVMGSWLMVANFKLDPNRPTIDFTKELLLATFNWLAEQEALVALPPRKPEHVKLELTNKQVNRIGRLVIVVLPLIAVILALIVWLLPAIRTRRQRPAVAVDPDQGGAR